MTMTGAVGSIRWAYYTAAQIEGYTITRDGKGPEARWSLVARIVHRDSFKCQQRPLVFVTPFRWQGRMVNWVWPMRDIEYTGGVVTARLGAPLETTSYGLALCPTRDHDPAPVGG